MSSYRSALSRAEFVLLVMDGSWWSQPGSNRRPQACKASALPTELWPRIRTLPHHHERRREARLPFVVGLERFELSTSRLSSARSNQLSYRPEKRWVASMTKEEKRRRRLPAYVNEIVRLAPIRLVFQSEPIACSELQGRGLILRKEVIQPQVPLRLPCYDFTPVADLTVAGCLLAVSAPS